MADGDRPRTIESFVHADPSAAFFDQIARALRPGGALVVVDDFRAGDRDDPALDGVRAGWHAPSLRFERRRPDRDRRGRVRGGGGP
jgi:SAM-dependent methyltransferase